MKLQNLFSKGIIDKDSDGRFVDSSMMIDAENFFVNTVDGSSNGVGKNALGNALKTAYNIVGGKNWGTGVDGTGNFIYNIVKGTIFDYIIEYNTETSLSEIVLQCTTGTRLNLKSGERVLNVDVIYSGTPYNATTQQGGNLLMFSGDSNPPRIININRAKTWGINRFTAEEIMLIKAPPLYPPIYTQVNTDNDIENFLKEKIVCFATRYRYKDDYYSAISSWSSYAFTPGNFSLEISSAENKGMINTFNAIDISFETGPREVIGIDLLFKYSNSNKVYRIDHFVKEDESWSDNSYIPDPIRFSNSKVYSLLPDDQYTRSYDNVPESNVAATFAGNRGFLANYKEGKNLVDKNGNKVVMEYEVGYSSLSSDFDYLPVSKINTVSPFDASVIDKGKIHINFSGTQLTSGTILSFELNVKSIPIDPQLDPERAIFMFNRLTGLVINQDYTNINELVLDNTYNGFKDSIEVVLNNEFKDSIVLPPDALPFPDSIYNGFQVSVIGLNTLVITLPTIKYEIVTEQTPITDPPQDPLPEILPNTFVKEYIQDDNNKFSLESEASKKSMKSYRNYEVVVFYRDLQGRKSSGLSSEENTVFIPLSQSDKKTVLTVDMATTMPPAWAKTYKFAIKETVRTYEEIYVTDFYEDGDFRWVKLEGGNKNKVNENDILLLKRDSLGAVYNPIKVKVIEISTKDSDFLPDAIVQLPGLYMRIKPYGFSMPYNPEAYKEYYSSASSRTGTPSVTINIPNNPITNTIPEGSVLSIEINSNYHNQSEFNSYTNKAIIASRDYLNFQDFFNTQINAYVFRGTNTTESGIDFGGIYPKESPGPNKIKITGTSNGVNSFWSSRSGFLNVKITLRTTAGFMVFENEGSETVEIYYETPEVFDVVNGEHVYNNGSNVINGLHYLEDTFNCISYGNGAESYQIRDAFNEKYIAIDYLPIGVSTAIYQQENRPSDITYSGIYNANSGVNKLNEFNLSLANFKDDIDKAYGPIYKIKGIDTNLQICQEDKDSQVFYGKDILYNADGSSNLIKSDNVLGNQDTYTGEYGISTHTESFDIYAGTTFHTDIKRGVVVKKINNGLHEISSIGMRNYFKKLFRDNVINRVVGKYDQHHDVYILNIKMNNDPNDYVTWVYSDEGENKGWLGRITFNPEDMCRVNGKFFSFKNGEIYEHNQANNRNTFYGVQSASSFIFNFSQAPSERKIFKTLEIEGTDAWEIELTSDLDKGFIHKEDFVLQENVLRAYTRTSNETIDTSLLSTQGIGDCTVNGLVLEFGFDLENEVSVGDEIRNENLLLVGTILSKTKNSLTLNAVANIVSGDYVLCSKPQSAESSGILGFNMQVKATLTKNTKTEVFAINSETSKSYS